MNTTPDTRATTRVAIPAGQGQKLLGLTRYMMKSEIFRLELDPIMGEGKAATIYADVVEAIAEAREREAREAQEQGQRKAALLNGTPVVDDAETKARFKKNRRELRAAAKGEKAAKRRSSASAGS